MARPLKQWLYKHRDNPYPTKTEKILLALGSQMTLVQVTRAHLTLLARGGGAGTRPVCAALHLALRPAEGQSREIPASYFAAEDDDGVGPGAELCSGKSFWVSSQSYQFSVNGHSRRDRMVFC